MSLLVNHSHYKVRTHSGIAFGSERRALAARFEAHLHFWRLRWEQVVPGRQERKGKQAPT